MENQPAGTTEENPEERGAYKSHTSASASPFFLPPPLPLCVSFSLSVSIFLTHTHATHTQHTHRHIHTCVSSKMSC